MAAQIELGQVPLAAKLAGFKPIAAPLVRQLAC